jgi:hypothetical protein
MSERSLSLDDFGCADPREFVDTAYRTILGRAPSNSERERMLAALLTGSTRPLVLGTLRYGEEGTARAVDVRGLRARYLVQRLFRIPVIGAALEWASAVMRLPRTLRFFRGAIETQAVRHALVHEQYAAEHASLAQRTADAERRLSDADRATADLALKATLLERALADLQQLQVDEAAEFRAANAEFRDSHAQARAQYETLAAGVATGAADLRALGDSAQATRARLDAIHPPALPEVLVVAGEPLAALARERAGIAADLPIDRLSAHARYALFETVFYDSRAVAAKQRIYIPYLDRELARQAPFLDLGCGRGEFLQILRETESTASASTSTPTCCIGCAPTAFRSSSRTSLRFSKASSGCFPVRPCCRLPSIWRRRQSSGCWRCSRYDSCRVPCLSSRHPTRCRPLHWACSTLIRRTSARFHPSGCAIRSRRQVSSARRRCTRPAFPPASSPAPIRVPITRTTRSSPIALRLVDPATRSLNNR